MKRFLRPVSLLLVPVLVLCTLPSMAFAQTDGDLNPVVPSDDSGSDDTTQAILVGLLVVIVGVLVVLGIKSDFGDSGWSQKSELEETYAEMLKDGELDTSAFAPLELEPVEAEERIVMSAE